MVEKLILEVDCADHHCFNDLLLRAHGWFTGKDAVCRQPTLVDWTFGDGFSSVVLSTPTPTCRPKVISIRPPSMLGVLGDGVAERAGIKIVSLEAGAIVPLPDSSVNGAVFLGAEFLFSPKALSGLARELARILVVGGVVMATTNVYVKEGYVQREGEPGVSSVIPPGKPAHWHDGDKVFWARSPVDFADPFLKNGFKLEEQYEYVRRHQGKILPICEKSVVDFLFTFRRT